MTSPISPKFKTRFFNKIRKVGLLRPVEDILVRLSQNKSVGSFFAKMAPNNDQYSRNSSREATRNGIRYTLDISDYMQYCIYFGIEIEPRDRLYGLVKNGTTVIDVGTNIGETLLNFAKINRDGRNIGFEPVPYLFGAARRNIELNAFSNILLENLALSSTEGDLVFNIATQNNSGGIYLSTPSETSDASCKIDVTTLDKYVSANNVANISLIKIDVEGFEIKVLKGAEKTIGTYKPDIFVEVDNSFLRRQNGSAAELVDLLVCYGYAIVHAETNARILPKDNFEGKHFDVICRHVSSV